MDLQRTIIGALVATNDARLRPLLGVIRGAAIALAMAGLVVGLVVGLILFARADGSLEVSLPARAPLTQETQNVAAALFGPTLRASSAFASPSYQHHPAFVVDGRRRPTLLEKWASRSDDPAPWIEVRFARPVHLRRVVLTHGGAFEKADYTADTYRLSCIRWDGKPAPSLLVEGNHLPRTTHPLDCSHASGVRLEFTPRAEADYIVRLYEVEAFSQ